MSARNVSLTLALLVLLIAGAWLLREHPPMGSKWYPACPLRAATGYYCPGCGTTRALHALLNGRISEALQQNCLAVLAVPLLGIWAVRVWWRWARNRNEPTVKRRLRFWVIIAAVVLTFGVLRNLPWPPFNMLAPLEERGSSRPPHRAQPMRLSR